MVFLHYVNYAVSMVLMAIGMFVVVVGGSRVKKLIGLGILQNAVLLFYVSLGYVRGAVAPILREGVDVYVSPLPSVLMLTAIVVGVATMAVGLSLTIRIHDESSKAEGFVLPRDGW